MNDHEKTLLDYLREETGTPFPEYLHFLEADGTISSKKSLDCTREDFRRHLAQTATLFDKWLRGEITQAQFDLLVNDTEEGHA